MSSVTQRQRIYAGIIIPGKGDPIYNGVVIVNNGVIDYVGTVSEHMKEFANSEHKFVEFRVPILMPGLWDCHTHFLGQTAQVMKQYKQFMDCVTVEPLHLAVGRSVKLARDAINCGYTSVREVGGFGVYVKRLIDEGVIQGPHIYAAGKALSITGGHGDSHNFPLGFVCCPHDGSSGKWSHIVDGADQCLFGVRNNIRNGAKCIKIMATGGVATLHDPVDVTQFNEEEIRAIVKECDKNGIIVCAHCHGNIRNGAKCIKIMATGGVGTMHDPLDVTQFNEKEIRTIVKECDKNGIIVCAHCHGRDGIETCIDNGVYCIEHGTFLDDTLAKKMAEKQCVYCPTRYIVERLAKDASLLPEQGKAKLMIDASRNAIKTAIKHGVTICAGSDLLFDDWGENTLELKYYVDAGMSELQAIECATANGPLSLGNPVKHRNVPKS
eukprot:CAMPEP_0197075148 /NCGR_PEP_ID=MMETSP1384-20130603/211464_1 /TAXON_ID=29189 /ORGANISM="Ammonia sp." /LENGTH=437 /DNA_ID=CAMNT_0042513991 /DNA_START=78 /DNA_END=1388 /DNA_ORIENTATION=+